MDIVLLIARLVLIVVFLAAGLAKLADRESRQALVDFGVPAALAAPLSALLPLAELAVAAALVPAATVWYGAIGAAVLLSIFIVGIAVNMARGRAPDCRCFGQIHSEPVGWSTLVRNGVLLGIAGLLVLQGPGYAGLSMVGWLGDLTTAQRALFFGGVIGLLVLAAEAVMLGLLLGQIGRVLLRLDGIEARLAESAAAAAGPETAEQGNEAATAPAEQVRPAVGLALGAPAPTFRLPGIRGEEMTLEALTAPGQPLLLVFMDPYCVPCNSLLPDVGRWEREYADHLTVAVISRGTVEANRNKIVEHGLSTILLQQNYEVADAFQANGTPGAVFVRSDGMIGSAVALGPDEIRKLVLRVMEPPSTAESANGSAGQDAATRPMPAPPGLGQPAPPVSLPDLDGKQVDLADFRGERTMLLFWNPGCGFCQQMLPDLKAWESKPQRGAPKLLVISTGTPEANREQGIQSPVVLDGDFRAMNSFGANGTPMAVMVDERGNLASALAVGAPQVLSLAGASQSLTA